MPTNTDRAKDYIVDRDRIDTRVAHGEDSFDRALGERPGVQPAAKPSPAKRAVESKPDVGRGGLADGND